MMNSATIHKIDAPVLPAKSEVFLTDCMEFMKTCKDNQFDLAVVDPPYGIGEDGAKNHSRGKLAKAKIYTAKNWDRETPNHAYFDELLRVSKNQIIWGGNYFGMPASNCWIVWDKLNGDSEFADCELAWTSFKTAVRKFSFRWQGMLQGNMKDKENRIHPTQKPVALYDWIYHNYAKPGDTILDTHLGSGSNRIAANKAGLDFTACEIDKEYYDAQEKRYQNFIAQQRLF
jgi:site-specific DNA-methyltransferase (adenine-specific)